MPMDFSLTEEQTQFKRTVIEFAVRDLADDMIRRDSEATFVREHWQKCAELGILGLPFPRAYGGMGADMLTTAAAFEGLGHGCKDSGLIFSLAAQMLSVQMPIFHFGTEEQKKRYLTKLCQGHSIGAHCMTEPDSGSDAHSLSTTATQDGDQYVLSGSKTFVTNAPIADVFIVFATVDKRKGYMGITAFVVEKDFPGFEVGRDISKMGLRTSPDLPLFLGPRIMRV